MYVYVIECIYFSSPCVCWRPPRQEEVLEPVYLHKDSCELPCVDAGPLRCWSSAKAATGITSKSSLHPYFFFLVLRGEISHLRKPDYCTAELSLKLPILMTEPLVLELQAFATLLYTFTGAQYLKLGWKGSLNG